MLWNRWLICWINYLAGRRRIDLKEWKSVGLCLKNMDILISVARNID